MKKFSCHDVVCNDDKVNVGPNTDYVLSKQQAFSSNDVSDPFAYLSSKISKNYIEMHCSMPFKPSYDDTKALLPQYP